jgi:hypothetical protein
MKDMIKNAANEPEICSYRRFAGALALSGRVITL